MRHFITLSHFFILIIFLYIYPHEALFICKSNGFSIFSNNLFSLPPHNSTSLHRSYVYPFSLVHSILFYFQYTHAHFSFCITTIINTGRTTTADVNKFISHHFFCLTHAYYLIFLKHLSCMKALFYFKHTHTQTHS